jgi:SMC interacting uncharacterized protein involved in chromosome segregation
MAKYKATWVAFDGTIHPSEQEATAYEAKLNTLDLKDYLKEVIKIDITAKQVELMFTEREYLTKLLNETGTIKKGQKPSKVKDKRRKT